MTHPGFERVRGLCPIAAARMCQVTARALRRAVGAAAYARDARAAQATFHGRGALAKCLAGGVQGCVGEASPTTRRRWCDLVREVQDGLMTTIRLLGRDASGLDISAGRRTEHIQCVSMPVRLFFAHRGRFVLRMRSRRTGAAHSG